MTEILSRILLGTAFCKLSFHIMATSYILLASALVGLGHAHVAAFAKGMYCENGTDPSNPNFNSNAPVAPLYNLTQDQWWFQHARGCDLVPPPPGVFLEIPAGGSFNVQLANNQAFTNLSYGGSYTSEWPDGGQHPEDWNGGGIGEGCIQGRCTTLLIRGECGC